MRLLARNNDFGLRTFKDFFENDFTFEGMKCDVAKKDGNYVIDLDLPGYDKKDINISLSDGYISVEAKKESSQEEQNAKGSYIHRERVFGSCSRSFYVGNGLTEENIKASYNNGTLTLTFPEMPTIENKKQITIE